MWFLLRQKLLNVKISPYLTVLLLLKKKKKKPLMNVMIETAPARKGTHTNF